MKIIRILRKIIVFSFFIFVIVVGSIFLYLKLSPKVTINGANQIMIYDDQNIAFFKGSEAKEWVNLTDISQSLIQATIYTEDKNYYHHFGFDFLRIGKAIIHNIKNRSMEQGASTITQQYAKNLFLNFDKTWKRKWEEACYTLKMEMQYSKDEILEGYLNTINYGHGKYGIENASKFYFGKSASDLSLAEASILTGIPKAPSNYSPLLHYEEAKKRQLLVLTMMEKNGAITALEKEKAYQEELHFIGEEDNNSLSSLHYFQDAVMDELDSIETIPKNYGEVHGLKIYTSLHYEAQSILEDNIKNAFPKDSDLETASVVMDPNTGRVQALVGGRDYNLSSYNRAIFAQRQVGSTMKPFLYYAALENGFTASSAFLSEKTSFPLENGELYTPNNYHDTYGNKPISMGTAIAYSENVYAVKTHMFLGYDALIQIARRIGITEKLESIPSLPLGTNGISLLHMAASYSAFANLGYKVTPHFIIKVEDGDGNVLYQEKDDKELVLNPSLVFILNQLLTATYDPLYIDYNYPTAISLNAKLTHTYGLKSGTTSSDNWNIGFNSNIVCAVWVGNDQNRELTTHDYKYAQNIWYQTVEKIEKDVPPDGGWYLKPKNVVALLVNPISGKIDPDPSKNTKLMYYLKGTEPRDADPTFDEIAMEEKD